MNSVWLLALFPALIAMVLVGVVLVHWNRYRQLAHEGRTLKPEDAVERVSVGHGYLVINRTNLPGRVWWVDSEHAPDLSHMHEVSTRTGFLCSRYGWAPSAVRRASGERVITVEGAIRTNPGRA